jgi:uncharacterized protein with HEPN domain
MNARDRVRLLDMLDEARKLTAALQGKTRAALDDYLTANGVRHAIALIGEAASQISDETQQQYPDLEWKDMIGMRNFVIHHYHRVSLDVVWDTATRNIPALITQLEAILQANPDTPSA